ncbi:hypothetical protein Acr_00g0021680 [Actinidia rufa]|uniref:Uncharacterized protein n=1 Tax=Actinidia rufa TaxID=165716 RepID=A0A7J0DCM3_9ERIC|nr:hypothetical protein Acr_00g0021680 [Actinidia rufa]
MAETPSKRQREKKPTSQKTSKTRNATNRTPKYSLSSKRKKTIPPRTSPLSSPPSKESSPAIPNQTHPRFPGRAPTRIVMALLKSRARRMTMRERGCCGTFSKRSMTSWGYPTDQTVETMRRGSTVGIFSIWAMGCGSWKMRRRTTTRCCSQNFSCRSLFVVG